MILASHGGGGLQFLYIFKSEPLIVETRARTGSVARQKPTHAWGASSFGKQINSLQMAHCFLAGYVRVRFLSALCYAPYVPLFKSYPRKIRRMKNNKIYLPSREVNEALLSTLLVIGLIPGEYMEKSKSGAGGRASRGWNLTRVSFLHKVLGDLANTFFNPRCLGCQITAADVQKSKTLTQKRNEILYKTVNPPFKHESRAKICCDSHWLDIFDLIFNSFDLTILNIWLNLLLEFTWSYIYLSRSLIWFDLIFQLIWTDLFFDVAWSFIWFNLIFHLMTWSDINWIWLFFILSDLSFYLIWHNLSSHLPWCWFSWVY